MAHLYLFQLTILVVVSTSLLVNSQFFFQQPIRPLYFLHKNRVLNPNARIPATQLTNTHNFPQSQPSANFAPNPSARSEQVTSSEEDQNEGNTESGSSERGRADFSAEYSGKSNGTELPAGFDASVRANRPPLEPRPVDPLYGDPAVMYDEEEQERPRYLWPFSTTVTVAKKRPVPHHHHHHLSYHDYVEQMYNTAHGGGHAGNHGGGGEGWGEEEYGLTDEEILASKGTKKTSKKHSNEPNRNANDNLEELDQTSSTLAPSTTTPRPPKPSRWSAFFGGGLLNRLRTSLNFGSTKGDKKKKKDTGDNDQKQQEQQVQPQPTEHRTSEEPAIAHKNQQQNSQGSSQPSHPKTSQEEDDDDDKDDYDVDRSSGDVEDPNYEELDDDLPQYAVPNTETETENEDEGIEEVETDDVAIEEGNKNVEEAADEGEGEIHHENQAEKEVEEVDGNVKNEPAIETDDTGDEIVLETRNKYRDDNPSDDIVETTTALNQKRKMDKRQKNKKLKNSIYTILFKTMDAIDKKFIDDDEEDEDPDFSP